MLKTILLIAGGVLLFIILLAIILHIRGKRKVKKLDENIKNLQKERQSLEEGGTLTLAVDEEVKESPSEEPKEEEFDLFEGEEKTPQEEPAPQIKENEAFDEDSFDDFLRELEEERREKKPRPLHRKKENDDFEDFLDKHSYTRRVIDKNLLKKLQSLPPDVKALVISSIFTRPKD